MHFPKDDRQYQLYGDWPCERSCRHPKTEFGVCVLWDMAQYYEHIDRSLLVERAMKATDCKMTVSYGFVIEDVGAKGENTEPGKAAKG